MRPNAAVLLALSISLLASSAFAGEHCYQLSTDGKTWPTTPELLCVEQLSGESYALTLRAGSPANTLATYTLRLAQRVRCLGCNQDLYATPDGASAAFKAVAVKFDGKSEVRQENGKTMVGPESGTVTIPGASLFYREAPAPAPAPPKAAKEPAKAPSPPTGR